MTDFVRQMVKVSERRRTCGGWSFFHANSGRWYVRYKGWKQGEANTLGDAVAWCKLNWRNVEAAERSLGHAQGVAEGGP